MPRAAFGFDSETANHEALKAKVLADRDAAREAAILQQAKDKEAERERRRSLGLPEESEEVKKKGWWRKGSRSSSGEDDIKSTLERQKELEGKTTVGEKMANLVFNAGRSKKKEFK